MKRIFSYIAALAAVIAVASCNKEPVQPEIETPVEPEYQTVTFEVAVPSAPQTRTSYGETVTFKTKLKVAVYVGNTGDVEEDNLNIFGVPGTYLPDVKTDIVEKELNKWYVTLTLVKNYHYDIAFWAQAETGAPYSIDWKNAAITADYTVAANNVKRDAFYHLCEDYCYLDAVENGNTKIELKRPFAQVNIGSADYKELEALYNKAGKESDLQTTITTQTTATAKVPSVFHMLTGRADTETDMAFALAPTTPEDGSYNLVDKANDITVVTGTDADGKDVTKSYTLVGMNYIFANPVTENPTTDLTLTFAYNGRSFTVDVPNAPYARNYQTNILGNFFTSANEFEVIIKPEFEGKDHIYDTDLTLTDAFKEDRDVNYTLTADQTISEPLVLDNGHTFVLNLEGNTISTTTDLWDEPSNSWSLISVRNGSTLVINAGENGALVAMENDSYAVDVQDGGKLIINGGKYVGNISAVYVYEGTAEINGGEFSIQQKSSFGDARYTLNCYDANYTAGTASISVNGGSFVDFNPADNAAEGPQTSFVDESHKSMESENADGSKTYTVVALNAIELALADANAASVTLTEDLDLNETIEIPAGRSLEIDLGKVRLRSPEQNQTALLVNGKVTIKGGDVHVKKEFIRMGAGASVVLQDVVVTSSSDNCIFIPKDATGAKVIVGAGTSLTSYNAAVIQSNGNTTGLKMQINGKVTSDDVAVYLPQVAECVIGEGAEISGLTAVEIRAGKLTVKDGAKLTATATEFKEAWNGSGSTMEGAAVAVSPHSTNLPIEVTIEGGEFNGPYALYEKNLASDPSVRTAETTLSIKDGKFNGKVYSQNCTGFITGGTFSETLDGTYNAPANNE